MVQNAAVQNCRCCTRAVPQRPRVELIDRLGIIIIQHFYSAYRVRGYSLTLDVDLCSFDVLLQERISLLLWTDMMRFVVVVFTRQWQRAVLLTENALVFDIFTCSISPDILIIFKYCFYCWYRDRCYQWFVMRFVHFLLTVHIQLLWMPIDMWLKIYFL